MSRSYYSFLGAFVPEFGDYRAGGDSGFQESLWYLDNLVALPSLELASVFFLNATQRLERVMIRCLVEEWFEYSKCTLVISVFFSFWPS